MKPVRSFPGRAAKFQQRKKAEEAYQIHPSHLEFVEKVFKKVCKKATIYDFA